MDDEEKRWKQQRATARGEGLRATLKAKLTVGGPQSAADLFPQIEGDFSLSEVEFQLDRMAEEGQIEGEQGKPYRLA